MAAQPLVRITESPVDFVTQSKAMNDSPSHVDEQLSLDRYFAAIWRAKWLILLLTISAAGVAWFIARREPATHTAVALVEVGRVWKEPIEDPYVTKEMVNGTTFLRDLAEKIGAKPHQVKRSVRADVVEGGARREKYPIFVSVKATTESAEESVKLAQAAADALIARHEKLFDDAIAFHLASQRRIEQRLTEASTQSSGANRDLVVKLESELDEVRANNESPAATRKTALIEPAAPGAAVQPEVWRRVGATAFLAGIIGIAAAMLVGYVKKGAGSGQ
ncbi:MAG TPA: Wzz/FepE/Etk N-terminal domain-containing protein [Blastocatellia bacterium]|nr:Wzz/FepE/Etk N-terminal domain-containing protein [Blastocatellia bacterium]